MSKRKWRTAWLVLPLTAIVLVLVAACGGSTTTTSSGTQPATATSAPTQTTPTSAASGATAMIKMVEQNNKYMFSPQTITIKAGTKVIWTNSSDAPHTVTSDSSAFTASQPLTEKQMFSLTFSKPGTYTYHCSIHTYMTATITVQP